LVSGQNGYRIKEQSNTPEEGSTTTVLGPVCRRLVSEEKSEEEK